MEATKKKFSFTPKKKKETMTDKEKAIQLVSQLIENAEVEDQKYKAASIKANKAQRAVGESFNLFHLKVLRDLIEKLKDA